ncbi:MAG: aminopeptidase P family N-terminal domain-containing protein, partial [Planctomycetes bacterium]|nr:aminopeptidase P family N-terminal domain-containing protein [Planctomycetota bacterium]
MSKKYKLIEIDWPEFGECPPPPPPTTEELQTRIDAARARMEKQGLTHLVVYADREHFANLAYLTGFDPRFEEAVLIIGQKDTPLLLVGNECEGYLTVSSLYNTKKLRHERFQSFSLLSQPREDSRPIKEIFADEGIKKNSSVGCVGWKYFSEKEDPAGPQAIEIPAYLVDNLRALTGRNKVINATNIFMDPDDGLRTFCSPSEVAYFEYSGILAAEGMKKMLFGLKEGMIDYDLMKLAEYNGEPLGCHLTLATGDNQERGLSSPIGAKVRRGDPLSTNVC